MSTTTYPEVPTQATDASYHQGNYEASTCQSNEVPFYGMDCHSPSDVVAAIPPTSMQEAPSNHWMLELNSFCNPISRAPSFSGSEETFTSPQVAFAVPTVYNMIGSHIPRGEMIQQPNWAAEPEQTWHSHMQENNHVWSVSTPMSTWSEDLMPQDVHYKLHNYNPNQAHLHTQAGAVLSPIPSPQAYGQEDDDSQSNSESDGAEDEDTCHTGLSSRRGMRSSLGFRNSQNGSMLKLGRWSMAVDAYTQPEQRNYSCIYTTQPDLYGRLCNKRFVRPEHCRRHIKTVHGKARDYVCKVPQCRRGFSRGDNLRDHYWTHLRRGGRAGKNDKMALADLKAILGPRDKKLVRKLKTKLTKQQLQKVKATGRS